MPVFEAIRIGLPLSCVLDSAAPDGKAKGMTQFPDIPLANCDHLKTSHCTVRDTVALCDSAEFPVPEVAVTVTV